MAKLMLIGKDGRKVEITRGSLDGYLTAKCTEHGAPGPRNGCGWSETYVDLDEATECAGDHADGVR